MFDLITIIYLGISAFSDFRRKQIWWPMAVLFMILSISLHFVMKDMQLWDMLAGIGLGLVLLVLSWVTREALGYGVGLTVAACGASLGFIMELRILFLAVIFAAVWSGILLVFRKAGRKDSFPFVPFLLAAQICIAVLDC